MYKLFKILSCIFLGIALYDIYNGNVIDFFVCNLCILAIIFIQLLYIRIDLAKTRRHILEAEINNEGLIKRLEKTDYFKIEIKDNYTDSIVNLFPELVYSELVECKIMIPDKLLNATTYAFNKNKDRFSKWKYEELLGFTLLIGLNTVSKMLGVSFFEVHGMQKTNKPR